MRKHRRGTDRLKEAGNLESMDLLLTRVDLPSLPAYVRPSLLPQSLSLIALNICLCVCRCVLQPPQISANSAKHMLMGSAALRQTHFTFSQPCENSHCEWLMPVYHCFCIKSGGLVSTVYGLNEFYSYRTDATQGKFLSKCSFNHRQKDRQTSRGASFPASHC